MLLLLQALTACDRASQALHNAAQTCAVAGRACACVCSRQVLTVSLPFCSCQFDFGVKPLPPEEDEALVSPCFMQCPAKMRHRLEAEPLCGGLGQ